MATAVNNTIPRDILIPISYMADNPSFACVCKSWKYAQLKLYESLRNEYTRSSCLSQLVTQITLEHLAKGQVATDLQIVQGVYFAVINKAKKLGDSHTQFKETHPSRFSTQRLEELFLNTEKQEAAALIELFKAIESGIPEATVFLNKISSLDIFTQAVKIRLWMNTNSKRLLDIHWLSLERRQLKVLPPEIGLMSHLVWLYLEHNELKTLPPEIGKLKNLSRLTLNHNQLSTIPPEFKQLSSLKVLVLHDNKFKNAAYYIEGMHLEKLEKDFDRNDFSVLFLYTCCTLAMACICIYIKEQLKACVADFKPLLCYMAAMVALLKLINAFLTVKQALLY